MYFVIKIYCTFIYVEVLLKSLEIIWVFVLKKILDCVISNSFDCIHGLQVH